MIKLRMRGEKSGYEVWAKEIVGSGLGQYGLCYYEVEDFKEGIYCGSEYVVAVIYEGMPLAIAKTLPAALSEARGVIWRIEEKHGGLKAFALADYERWMREYEERAKGGFRGELIRVPVEKAAMPVGKRLSIWERDGGKCCYCQIELEVSGNWHIDHKHPKSRGGGNEEENLALACAKCNQKKHAKTAEEFMAQLAERRKQIVERAA